MERRKTRENNPIASPRESVDQAAIVARQRERADFDIGPGIGKYQVEGDPARSGVEQPVDQAGPNRLEQSAGTAASSGLASDLSSMATRTTGTAGTCRRHGWDVLSVRS